MPHKRKAEDVGTPNDDEPARKRTKTKLAHAVRAAICNVPFAIGFLSDGSTMHVDPRRSMEIREVLGDLLNGYKT